MIYKTEWRESGNKFSGSGNIERLKYPLHLWLLDRWLEKHPHWHLWKLLWGKILPYWGDPFCAAYCLAWSKFYFRYEIVEYSVEVGYDNLSQQTKDWFDKNAG